MVQSDGEDIVPGAGPFQKRVQSAFPFPCDIRKGMSGIGGTLLFEIPRRKAVAIECARHNEGTHVPFALFPYRTLFQQVPEKLVHSGIVVVFFFRVASDQRIFIALLYVVIKSLGQVGHFERVEKKGCIDVQVFAE